MKSEKLKQISLNEFTKSAKQYDSTGYEGVKTEYERMAEELKSLPFERLLDCGCGTGAAIELFSKKFENKQFVGIDITPAMIEIAKKRNVPRTDFFICDSESLDFAPESFDVIICIHSFHHYPNPELFLRGVVRILKKDGYLIIRDNGRKTKFDYWVTNYIKYPINHLKGFGDVHCYRKEEITKLCVKVGLVLKEFDIHDENLMHCVIRKINDTSQGLKQSNTE